MVGEPIRGEVSVNVAPADAVITHRGLLCVPTIVELDRNGSLCR